VFYRNVAFNDLHRERSLRSDRHNSCHHRHSPLEASTPTSQQRVRDHHEDDSDMLEKSRLTKACRNQTFIVVIVAMQATTQNSAHTTRANHMSLWPAHKSKDDAQSCQSGSPRATTLGRRHQLFHDLGFLPAVTRGGWSFTLTMPSRRGRRPRHCHR
jgi:hypothetical protein